jgi:hypothetical protein
MDAVMQEFIRLCDVAIDEAAKVVRELHTEDPDGLIKLAELTLRNVRGIKESAVNGTLRRPSRGAGFGLSRAVGEWAEGTPLMAASRAVEAFYQDSM